MKTYKSFFIFLFTVFALNLSAQNQQQEYDQLVIDLKQLRTKQDSTQNLIERNRQLLENRPDNKDTYSKAILRLEDELYEINSQISKLSSKINAVESSMPVKKQETENRNTGTSSSGSLKESANLFRNYFFMTNLSKEEQAIIASTAAAETKAQKLITQIEPLYTELAQIKEEYDAAETPRKVEELMTKAQILKKQIEELDREIDNSWGKVFKFKSDKYPVLLDKLSGIDRLKLEQIDNNTRLVRRAESLSSSKEAPNAIIFPLQKELTLYYEQVLAANLELKMSMDSLARQVSALPKSKPDFPALTFAPRVLVVYTDVIMDGKYDFNGVGEIPELIIPHKGVYYSIGVATMPKAPADINFFRGGRPLHYVKLDNNMLQYVLGGYRTYAEAAASVTRLQKAGYRNPVIAAWVDGVYTPAAKAKAAQELMGTSKAGYNVEIRTTNSSVSSSLHEVVEMHAKGKQVSRVQEGREFIFTITGFTTKEEAEVIAEILRSKGNSKVTVSENN